MTTDQIQSALAAIDAAIESELVHRYQVAPRRVALELYNKLDKIKGLSPVVQKQYNTKIQRAADDCVDKMNETL